jgi:hypothetical protein
MPAGFHTSGRHLAEKQLGDFAMKMLAVVALWTLSTVVTAMACPTGQYERCHYLSGNSKTCYCTR